VTQPTTNHVDDVVEGWVYESKVFPGLLVRLVGYLPDLDTVYARVVSEPHTPRGDLIGQLKCYHIHDFRVEFRLSKTQWQRLLEDSPLCPQ